MSSSKRAIRRRRTKRAREDRRWWWWAATREVRRTAVRRGSYLVLPDGFTFYQEIPGDEK